MSMPLNRHYMQVLVNQDLDWLRAQPNGPERDHVIAILENYMKVHDLIRASQELINRPAGAMKPVWPSGNLTEFAAAVYSLRNY